MLISLRQNGQDESRLLNLRRFWSSRSEFWHFLIFLVPRILSRKVLKEFPRNSPCHKRGGGKRGYQKVTETEKMTYPLLRTPFCGTLRNLCNDELLQECRERKGSSRCFCVKASHECCEVWRQVTECCPSAIHVQMPTCAQRNLYVNKAKMRGSLRGRFSEFF